MKTNIVAVVVAFYPDTQSFLKTLEILKEQVSSIIIVNNSEKKLDIFIKNVSVVELGENMGLGYAQNIGMKIAFKSGASFVLQMDQDSIPEKDMVLKLLNMYTLVNENIPVGLIGPQSLDKFTKKIRKAKVNEGKEIGHTGNFIVSATLCSGSLIPKEAYEKAGDIDEALFIDAVDFEFCWRLQACGYSVIKTTNTQILHRLGDGEKKLLGFIDVSITAPFRHYYQFRNTILLQKKVYAVPMYWRISNLFKIAFKLAFYPFLFKDGKKRLRFMLMGIRDGLRGKYGRLEE